ncbi:hypothetical protein QN277_003385 [Acacia crassicarpa]|uniref:Retrotransposon gag protein n=1 Tax=Acacia crassicarpa TaxID=499986 RepID=A0AAE1MAT1_9FABA|nr:hypothetical protein QN277_003385 [Acacia crassicarpa]
MDTVTSQLSLITSELHNLSIQRGPPSPTSQTLVAPSCDGCGSMMHITSLCPNHHEEVNAMYQGRPNQQQQRWDSNTTTYNEGRRPNSNFGWRNQEGSSYQVQPYGSSQGQMVPIQESKGDENTQLLKSMVSQLTSMNNRMMEDKAVNESQFSSISSTLQKLQGDMAKDGNQMAYMCKKLEELELKHNNVQSHLTQLSNSVSDVHAKTSDSIPSNTVINPKSLNAIDLRSGKKVRFPEEADINVDEEIEVESPRLSPMKLPESESFKEKAILERKNGRAVEQPQVEQQPLLREVGFKEGSTFEKGETSEQGTLSNTNGKEVKISQLPFPKAYFQGKKMHDEQNEKEMYDLFSKLHINVPFFQLVKSMPSYCKFLKELCTNKRKFRPNERVQISSNVSALFKPPLPVKCKDPGSFTIPCTIGNVNVAQALLDLGTAINVMPSAIFKSLGVKELKRTSVVLQLAYRSIRHPLGIIEDLLVKVKDLVFPADFYVLDMPQESSECTLILGRPFMRIASTFIDMRDGSITMKVGNNKLSFNMYEAMKHPSEDYSLLGVNSIDFVIDDLVEEYELNLHTDDCNLECGISLDSCGDKFPSPSVNKFDSLGSEISDLNPSMVDCWLSSPDDFSLTSLNSFELNSSHDSLFNDDACEEGGFLNVSGHKLVEEAEFEVGSQDLDDLFSKGIALTLTKTSSHVTHFGPQHNVVKGPPSNSLLNHRTKITPHTLRFLNELITPCEVGMKETTFPKPVAAVSQPSISSTLRKTNEQVVESMELSTSHAPPKLAKGSISTTLDLPRLIPSIVQPPDLELKPLPSNLKYAFLAADGKLPVIISNSLSVSEEERLLDVLSRNRKALGWTLADIPGISPAICTHRILLNEESKPLRQPKRRLNPLILDVVKKEVTKLLSAGIIYPISDSEWVSPVHVVPKKSGITVVKNENDELIPRVQNA